MENKHFAVYFTSNNARIVSGINPNLDVSGHPHILINPSLKEVKGVAPHHWKIKKRRIIPMTAKEARERDAHIAKYGVDNNVKMPTKLKPVKVEKKKGALAKLKDWLDYKVRKA